jgi:hypothetical protein
MDRSPELSPNQENPDAFSIGRALAAKEDSPYGVLEFEYNGQRYSINVVSFSLIENLLETNRENLPNRYRTVMIIRDSQGLDLGRLSGRVIYEGQGYAAGQSYNLGYAEDEGIEPEVPHIKDLVGESISQLILKNVFGVWFSSLHLNEGSQKMYETIRQKHQDLAVIENDTSFGQGPRWKITLPENINAIFSD